MLLKLFKALLIHVRNTRSSAFLICLHFSADAHSFFRRNAAGKINARQIISFALHHVWQHGGVISPHKFRFRKVTGNQTQAVFLIQKMRHAISALAT